MQCLMPSADGPSLALRDAYRNARDEDIVIYGAHATRPKGFCDILLSGRILTSYEVDEFFPGVQKHRGATSHPNRTISFSLGLVSFKYAKRGCRYRHLFRGGLGVFLPLEHLLTLRPWRISHCSSAGGIAEKDLVKENLAAAIHMARRRAELDDDGFGNVFEFILDPVGAQSSAVYPRVALDRSATIAIPARQTSALERMLKKRQALWLADAEKVKRWNGRSKMNSVIGLRACLSKQELLDRIVPYLQPFNWDRYNFLFYSEDNLEEAMLALSLRARV